MNLHIRWRIAFPYILLILLIMILTATYLAYNFRLQGLEQLQEQVATDTSLLAEQLSRYDRGFEISNDECHTEPGGSEKSARQ